jgi:hypothetical protein
MCRLGQLYTYLELSAGELHDLPQLSEKPSGHAELDRR